MTALCNAGVASSNMHLSARNRPAERPAELSHLPSARLSHRLHIPITDANAGSADSALEHHRYMTTNQPHLTDAPVLGPVSQQPSEQTHLTRKAQPAYKPAEAMQSQVEVQRQCSAAPDLASRPVISATYADVARQQGASQGPRLTHRAEIKTEAVLSAVTAVSSGCDHSQLDRLTQHAAGNRTAAMTSAVPLQQLQRGPTSATSTGAVAAEDQAFRTGLQNSQAAAPSVAAPAAGTHGLSARGTVPSTGAVSSSTQGSCQYEAARSGSSSVRHSEADSPRDSKENQPQAVTMARAVQGKSHTPTAVLAAVKPSRPISSSKVRPRPLM